MKHLSYILCTATLLLLMGCSNENPEKESQGLQELRFRSYIEEGGEIRPMAGSASRAIAGDLAAGYHLNALFTKNDYPASTFDKLMWNVEMNSDGTYKSSSEKRYFWAVGDSDLRHSFFAYSANAATTAAGKGVIPSTLTVAGNQYLQVDYVNPDEPVNQMDFLCSQNESNLKLTSTAPPFVGLVFKHRLARVMVKLMGTGGATLTKCQATITYKSNTIRSKFTHIFSDTNNAIYVNQYHTGTHNLGSSFTLSGSVNTPDKAIEVGDMILIPQSALASGWVNLKLTYTPDGASAALTASTQLPAITLTEGKQHEILVNVHVETNDLSVSEVVLVNWNILTGTIDKL